MPTNIITEPAAVPAAKPAPPPRVPASSMVADIPCAGTLTLDEPPAPSSRVVKSPSLRFTPYAWAKLVAMRDFGDTEVGGFAICLEAQDPFLVHDILVPKQYCNAVYCDFDMDDLTDRWTSLAIDKDLSPNQIATIWIHTHPGSCPNPSHTDEETFASRCTGAWSVMYILAREGQEYCRLKGKDTSTEFFLPVAHPDPYAPSEDELKSWKQDYDNCVREKVWPPKVFNQDFKPPVVTYPMNDAWDMDGGWRQQFDVHQPQSYQHSSSKDPLAKAAHDELEEAITFAMAGDMGAAYYVIENNLTLLVESIYEAEQAAASDAMFSEPATQTIQGYDDDLDDDYARSSHHYR